MDPLGIEVASLGVGDIAGENKPLFKQLSDIVFSEDPRKTYNALIKQIKGSENALVLIKAKKEHVSEYTKGVSEETVKLQQLYKDISAIIRKKIEDCLKETKKLVPLHEELVLVRKCIDKVKADMAYFKIPSKFPKCIGLCEEERSRRKVFCKVATELAEQLERIFDGESKLRDYFNRKYGKYVPKEMLPDLNNVVPTLRLSEMLKKSGVVGLAMTEEQQAEALEKYYGSYLAEKEKAAENTKAYKEMKAKTNKD